MTSKTQSKVDLKIAPASTGEADEILAADPLAVPLKEPTRTEEFAKTATAAKMSGTYNEAAGYFKRKFGEFTGDAILEDSGRDQQLLGKVHRLVGTFRSLRETATSEFKSKRIETQAICRKHGGRILDVVSDFVEDIKKTLLK